jgi:hypothetical protein
MNPHPYLRAYMAGVVVPSVLVLVGFTVFFVVRFGYNPAYPVERVLMFPLALVPAIWGAWNMVYLALRGHHGQWYSLGVHGAVAPLFLGPLAVVVFGAIGLEFPVDAGRVALIAVPVLMVIYYLIWKHVVAFLNEVLGIA